MPDIYATIAEQSKEIQERLAGVLEIRAANDQQRAMLETYLSEIDFPDGARVLEVGCGTGPICRVLAGWPGVGEVVGADPSPVFIEKAREQAREILNLSFELTDGRSLSFGDGEFDAVVFHTVLCHVPGCEKVLAEGFRVLKPGGWVAVFDGDYATTTLANGDHDPLQACADAAISALVHDRWLVRRLPAMIQDAGFERGAFRSHGFAEIGDAVYMASILDRGADVLTTDGLIGTELAEAIKAEGRRRINEGTFFGHIAYASVTARKSA